MKSVCLLLVLGCIHLPHRVRSTAIHDSISTPTPTVSAGSDISVVLSSPIICMRT